MNRPSVKRSLASWLSAMLLLVLVPSSVSAHCDTMNGPVVTAASKALETGNVNLILIWVQKGDEAAIREAFQQTLAVRKLNPEARKLADTYFFETVVRIHRAGEGVAYTGLKPAGTEVEPGIAAADASIESGSPDAIVKEFVEAVRVQIAHQHAALMKKKRFNPDDVEAGRVYVASYVTFIHYIERLHQSLTQSVHGHAPESPNVGMHHED